MSSSQYHPVLFDQNILFVSIRKFNEELKNSGVPKQTRMYYVVLYIAMLLIALGVGIILLAGIIQIIVNSLH